jgi:hypothetical protein
MMAERGVEVSHTTILRWVVRYVPEFEKRWNRHARRVGSSWRVDETYVCPRQMALPISCGRQAWQERRFSVASGSRYSRGTGVLPKSVGDESHAMAAQGDSGWPYTESPGATAIATRESEVEIRGGAELQVPQQYR